MRYNELSEDIAIGPSKRAWASLSDEAKYAIESWESVNWTGGPLEKHIKANDEIAQEIHRAVQPVIAAIGAKTIRLYRGEQKSDWDSSQKYLESWTSDPNVAASFAGLQTPNGRKLIKEPITDEQIEKAMAQLRKTGFVRFRHQKFVLNKKVDWKDPQYNGMLDGPIYNIYDKDNQFVTDTDDPEYHWREDKEWIDKQNAKVLNKGYVREEDISVDRIIWVTNNLNSKEYIVRK